MHDACFVASAVVYEHSAMFTYVTSVMCDNWQAHMLRCVWYAQKPRA